VDAGGEVCASPGLGCEETQIAFRFRLIEIMAVRHGCSEDADCVAVDSALVCDDGFVFSVMCPQAVRASARCSFEQLRDALAREACAACARAGCTQDDVVTGLCSGGDVQCVQGRCVR
jgi:hypothetical protein